MEKIGVSQAFADLCWTQVEAGVRGETSLDAWDARKGATGTGPDVEKYKNEYFAAAFSDALAERLRKISELFPANPGFEFAIYYKRRN